MLFQAEIPWEVITPILIITIASLVGIVLLKVGLSIVKAEKKTSMKNVLMYYLIYLGTIMFILMQLIFIEMRGFNIIPILGLSILAVFIVTNMINIFHDTGIKKAIFITVLLIIPITIAMSIIGPLMGEL